MSAIPAAHRVVLTEDQFLVACARYALDVRRVGVRIWVYDLNHLDRNPNGEPWSPQEAATYVYHEFVDRLGRPILTFICDEGAPSRIGVAYTSAGKEWAAERRTWTKAIGMAPAKRSRIRRTRARTNPS